MSAARVILATVNLGIFSRKKAVEAPKDNGDDAFIRCPACNKVLHATIARCPYCSAFLEVKCPNCDRTTNRMFRDCPYCKESLKGAK